MTSAQAKAEIARLTALIAHHNFLYYERNAPEISDYEFDRLLNALEILEKKFPAYRLPNSPTQRVGERPTQGFVSLRHEEAMLSLSNTYNQTEVAAFVRRVREGLGGICTAFFCELKLDGVALSLHYHQSKLMAMVTRGDGEKGDDVTRHFSTVANIPACIATTCLNVPERFEVRGEVIMLRKDFESLNASRTSEGLPPLANPRNTAAGTLKRLKSESISGRPLRFYPYALHTSDLEKATHQLGMRKLKEWGFEMAPGGTHCENLEDLLAYIEQWDKRRAGLPFDIDGVVIKVNDIAQQKQLGHTLKSPRWAIAYKYAPQRAATVLETVSYQVGRTGAVTPVAILTPVQLAGTVVRRASLHNAQTISLLDLQCGSVVFVEKGGDIIPKITGVDRAQRSKDNPSITFPTRCPACHTQLEKHLQEAVHYCPNQDTCPAQCVGRLVHFVQRDTMHIQHVGNRTVQLLFEKGLIHTPADFYTLEAAQLVSVEGLGDTSVQRILSSIEASKQAGLERLLFALSIRYVGASAAQRLAQHFQDMRSVMSASLEDLVQVKDIGQTMAESVFRYFRHTGHIELIDRLQKHGLSMQAKVKVSRQKKDAPISGRLQNKVFVISGRGFKTLRRDGFKLLIEQHGGTSNSHVSSRTDYLVVGSKPGPTKVQQAQKWQVKIIEEPEFLSLLS